MSTYERAAGNASSNIPAPGSRGPRSRPKPVPEDAQNPPAMTGQPIADSLLPDICAGLARVLGGDKYCVMGGVALRLLGSKRPTSDIDLFVPGSSHSLIIQKFVEDGGDHFGTWKSTRKTVIWYRGLDGQRYRVYIWVPSRIGHHYPTAPAGAVVNGVRILRAPYLLDHKCKSWGEHLVNNDQTLKRRDAGDIMFLLEYMRSRRMGTTNREVTHATPQFFDNFLNFRLETQPLFIAVGLLKRVSSK